MRTALPAPTDTPVFATAAVATAPASGVAATTTAPGDAGGVATDASGPTAESPRPSGNAPITVRVKVITGGQSPSVDVQTTGSDSSTSTPPT